VTRQTATDTPPPTIRQVAQAAGVSRTTVSLALRRDPRITAKTRAHVAAVAQRLGYRANPLAGAFAAHLRSKRTVRYVANLALLVPSKRAFRERRGLPAALRDARARAVQFGYQVEPVFVDEVLAHGRSLNTVLAARGIHGLLIPPWRAPDPPLDLRWEAFACVALGGRQNLPGLHVACANHLQITLLALREMAQLGYRRIGLYLKAAIDTSAEERFSAALRQFHAEQTVRCRVPPLFATEIEAASFYAWYEHYQPDALLSAHPELLDWLRMKGHRVPEHCGFANLWVMSPDEASAGIDQRNEWILAAGVDLLIGQLNRNERGLPEQPCTVLVDGRWVPGRTLRRQTP
jgi:LacI family transcriptional regulator